MKPIDQTRFGNPGGNCFQASLASILEMSLGDVPDFCNSVEEDWEAELNEWLYARGLFAMHVDAERSEPDTMKWLTDNAIVLAAVKSATTPDGLHTVVYHKGRVIHDPHPKRAHMNAVPISFDVFVALNPAAWHSLKGEMT